MKLIVGLGNPGEKYRLNRHNVGYMVIDKLSQTLNSKSQILKKSKIKIFKSQSFMNDSGSFVKKMLTDYGLQTTDLYIIHDDLDIKLGEWKIQVGKGPKEHGGINDIEQKLGTKDFTRIRIGVDNRKPEFKVSGEEYVLEDFTKGEREILDKVTDEICKKLETL